MSVFQVKNAWYYCYYINGKPTRGKCDGCTSKAEAKKFESKIKGEKLVEEVQIDKIEYHEKKIVELNGGNEILLTDAFSLAMSKPCKHRACPKREKSNAQFFSDFVAFMADKFPDVKTMQAVKKPMAEAYIKYVSDHGRYITKISYKRGEQERIYKNIQGRLSGNTVNEIHNACNQVFSRLAEDSGMTYNPFKFEKVEKNAETRDVFSEEEVCKILKSPDTFVQPLFFIALFTGLRRGDICLLKWADIDFKTNFIYRRQNKTRVIATIPIIPVLRNFLFELYQNRNKSSDYVLPDQAEMYIHNASGVSYRIKSFLDGLGIETTKEVKGRSRKISVKDVHSCRHTFAALAGQMGVSLPIVQSILGHMTPEMTKHYMSHASQQQKTEGMMLLENSGILKMLPAPKTEYKSIEEALKGVSADKIPAIIAYLEQHLSLKDKKAILKIANA